MSKKPTIEDYIQAILDRYKGTPYSQVLESHGITPNQFVRAVSLDLADLILSASGNAETVLEAINTNPSRRIELFRMEEEFLEQQYLTINGKLPGRQRKIYDGTYKHPNNVEYLVYFALSYHNKNLDSTDRASVVDAIKSLPTDLNNYLLSIGLGGLMISGFEKGEQGSPLAVLKAFDRAYQRETKDVSLFDLTQKVHLHEWGDHFNAPQSYWQNPLNVENAVYHVLVETNPRLAYAISSKNRASVVDAIKSLPTDLKKYFRSIGLGGLMMNGFEKGEQDSPLAVLKAFDRAYQRETGNKSLFDLSQEAHLELYAKNRLVR